MLIKLIYSSRATQLLNRHDLSSILSVAQRNNAVNGLTGALCYANGTFLQYLEGERLVVDSLYQRLLNDERHSQLQIESSSEIADRRFPTWSMGFFSYENNIGQLFLKHSRRAEFSPFSMTTSEVSELFDEVAKYLSIDK